MRHGNLFVPSKAGYVRGEKPDVSCILCAVYRKNPKVRRLDVARTRHLVISLNLFPYSPGHLMIFPIRHVEDPRHLRRVEQHEMDRLTGMSLDVLDRLYKPSGYNVGMNIGNGSGASIAHIHLHIVPRFPNEIGFMDIIGGSKIIVGDPSVIRRRLAGAFKKCLGSKS